jgi:hypothetical protein
MNGYLARLAARSVASDVPVRPLAATIFAPAGLEGHAATARLEQAADGDAEQAAEDPPGVTGGLTVPGDSVVEGSAPSALPRGLLPGESSAADPELSPPAAFVERHRRGTQAPTPNLENGHEGGVIARAPAGVDRRPVVVGGEPADSPHAADRHPGHSRHTPLPMSPPATLQLPEANASMAAGPSAATAVGEPPASAPDLPARPAGIPSGRHTPSLEASALAAAAPSPAALPVSGRAGDDPGLPVPVAAHTRRARRGVSSPTGDTSRTVPTVQVTIGRVEVRAVVAPGAVQQPERERRPTLTLAEYLQAREAGR